MRLVYEACKSGPCLGFNISTAAAASIMIVSSDNSKYPELITLENRCSELGIQEKSGTVTLSQTVPNSELKEK